MNCYKYFLLVCLICFIKILNASTTDNEFKGTWAGIEVMGCDAKTAQIVRNLIPIEKGTPFYADKEQFNSWCDLVKGKINAKDINCGFIGFLKGEYYFDVEIIPHGTKETTFRSIPKLSTKSPTVPRNLEKLYEQWDQHFLTMIKTGVNPYEEYKNGFLDYQDPYLHEVALKLANSTYRYNDILLKVIRYSQDPNQRCMASSLLAWSKHPNNIEYILKWDLLNDPDENVRNDLARSLSFTLVDVKDKKLLNDSISMFCKQATLPSHGDRNKAVVSLQDILNKHKDLVISDDECKQTLTYISQNSILPNVGGVAKTILTTIEKPQNG